MSHYRTINSIIGSLLGLLLVGLPTLAQATPPQLLTTWKDYGYSQQTCALKAKAGLTHKAFKVFFNDGFTIRASGKSLTTTILCWDWAKGSRAIFIVTGQSFDRAKQEMKRLKQSMNPTRQRVRQGKPARRPVNKSIGERATDR